MPGLRRAAVQPIWLERFRIQEPNELHRNTGRPTTTAIISAAAVAAAADSASASSVVMVLLPKPLRVVVRLHRRCNERLLTVRQSVMRVQRVPQRHMQRHDQRLHLLSV